MKNKFVAAFACAFLFFAAHAQNKTTPTPSPGATKSQPASSKTTNPKAAPATIPQEVQQPETVLFTLAGKPIHLSEFEYVYHKNNSNAADAYTKQSLEDYLKLYINFRLKVKEAEDLGMDTIEAIKTELNTYRQQLAKSYLFDREVNEQLIQEAYLRMKKEIRASHILVALDESSLPGDTLEAYKKAMDIRKRLLKGEEFEKLAKLLSADPSAKNNGGDIGYFTVFQTVYPFESAVYNLKPNEISMPVRTRFGYHIVKVTDVREALGKMKAAHILLKLPENPTPEQDKTVREKAEHIYKEVVSGNNTFEELVERYSEDKQSFKKGGELPEFGIGKMVAEFENAAFALNKDGDVSKPVRTEFGYHIIKRISREPLPDFDEAKGELKKRVERDSRSSIAKTKMMDKIKAEYGFVEYPKNKYNLFDKIGEKVLEARFKSEGYENVDAPLFNLAGRNYTQENLLKFIEERQRRKRTEPASKVFNDYYNLFVEEIALAYEETQLERKYPDFKNLMKEYHDGILLFELTDKKVWSKAVSDTVGLQEFHKAIQNKYMWGERADITTYTVKPEVLKAVKKAVVKGKMTPGAIAAKYNTKDTEAVSFENSKHEKGHHETLDKMNWTKGAVSEDKTNADGRITFVKINDILAPAPKLLNEAKGFIISDYQEYLEKSWIAELKAKYPVQIMPGVLDTMVKK